MATYKVRKDLETPLLVFGVTVRFFYLFAGVGAIIVIILLVGCLSAMNGGGWALVGVQFLISFLILVWLAGFLKKKSKIVKYNFGKNELTITNRDILKNL